MIQIYLWSPEGEYSLNLSIKGYIIQRMENIGHEGKALDISFIQITSEKETNPDFSILKPDDPLILHLHGSQSNNNELCVNPILFIDGENSIDAKGLANFLMNCGLKKEHEILKLAACYSDKVAKLLQSELKKLGYDKISVYGYKGEYCLGAGEHNTNMAGLEPKHLVDKDGQNSLNLNVMRKYSANFFKSTNYRVCYGPKAEIANAETAESYAKYVSNAVVGQSRPTTRQSISASRPEPEESIATRFANLSVTGQSLGSNPPRTLSFSTPASPRTSLTRPPPANPTNSPEPEPSPSNSRPRV